MSIYVREQEKVIAAVRSKKKCSVKSLQNSGMDYISAVTEYAWLINAGIIDESGNVLPKAESQPEFRI